MLLRPTFLMFMLAALMVPALGCGQKREPVGARPSESQGQFSATQSRPAAPEGARYIQAKGLELALTERWRQIGGATQYRIATYRCDGPDGETELVLSFLGGIAGTADSNLNRWIGQLKNPSDVKKNSIQSGGLLISLLHLRGSYTQSPMMRDPETPELGPYAEAELFGMIVEGGPEGPLFVKMIGPAGMMTRLNDDVQVMVASMRALR